MSDLKYGILGCGNISKTHVFGITNSEGAVLSAVCDTVEEKAKALGAETSVPAFTDFDAFLDEVDAVTLCIPSGMHWEYAIRAAQRGKHVLTEKPLDITLGHATLMVEECEKAGVKLGCISQHRFTNDMRKLYDAVQNGELGTLLQGDSFTKWYRSQAYYDSAGWRGTWEFDGGGCLMNQGVHYVDMIQWIMGGVKSVQARTRTVMHKIEVEDQAIAMVEYNNGAMGVIQATTCAYPGMSERIEVHGTKGSVVIESDRAKIWVTKEVADHEPFGPSVVLGQDHHLEPDETTASWNKPHLMQIQDFTNAVRENRDPFITGRAALEPLKVILAIYESSHRGGSPVHLDELVP